MNAVLPCGATVTVRDGDQSDSTILAELERDDYRLGDLKGVDVAVDVGANIGLVSVTLACLGASVHAYEPDADNFALLIENAAGWPIMARQEALFDGSPSVSVERNRSGLTRTGHNLYDAAQVTASTLDVAVERGRYVDFLKMDVEGAEATIIGSATSATFERIGVIAMEYHDAADVPLLARCLATTHHVEVCPKPHKGGMLYARRR